MFQKANTSSLCALSQKQMGKCADDATTGFTGVLDELRMTAGFLSAERFMYAYSPGLACVIR